mmetsp:Transcript_6205/g.9381  ORF Transcript_6205/g.9381 Transcript_6205/m.9381 type:complete len:109 (+) Transcript_6205:314-640(+)
MNFIANVIETPPSRYFFIVIIFKTYHWLSSFFQCMKKLAPPNLYTTPLLSPLSLPLSLQKKKEADEGASSSQAQFYRKYREKVEKHSHFHRLSSKLLSFLLLSLFSLH